MVSVYGGTLSVDPFHDMSQNIHTEDWYVSKHVEQGGIRFGIETHGNKDAQGYTILSTNNGTCVVFGTISNHETGELTADHVVTGLLNRPTETLRALTGPFALACTDDSGERIILGTDKIGSRPLYYTTEENFAFASDVSAVITQVQDPSVNLEAISDLLLLAGVWGEKTLIKEIQTLPAGSYLEFDHETVTTERYWTPTFSYDPQNDYLQEFTALYQKAVKNMADQMTGDIGLWLSGGLDSRVFGKTLLNNIHNLTTFTYDKPSAHKKIIGKEDSEIARLTANHLGIPNIQVPAGGESLVEHVPDCIELVDGMIPWTTTINLAPVFNIPTDEVDILLEGSGHSEFFGEGIRAYNLDAENFDSPAESLLQRYGREDPETIRRLLNDQVSPKSSLRSETATSPYSRFKDVVLDVNNQNTFANFQFLSNKITRSQFGTRQPFSDGDLLQQLAELPTAHRMQTFPFTDGSIPHGPTVFKLELSRTIDSGIETIPYERTGFEPTRPYLIHTAGYVAENIINRFLGQTRRSRFYTENQDLNAFANEYLADAKKRTFWNSTLIDEIKRQQESGEANNMNLIGAITTSEFWLQHHVQ